MPRRQVKDVEMVIFDTETGSTVFSALRGRITAGRRLAREATVRPANLVLFDMLAEVGEDLTGLPLRQRRARLERLLLDAPPALAPCPQTSDVERARTRFDELAARLESRDLRHMCDGKWRLRGAGKRSHNRPLWTELNRE